MKYVIVIERGEMRIDGRLHNYSVKGSFETGSGWTQFVCEVKGVERRVDGYIRAQYGRVWHERRVLKRKE